MALELMRLTLKERMRQLTGVWVGTYTHLAPDARLLDRFNSRQETRLEGNDWYERVTYFWPEGDAIQFDFHAQFDAAGEEMIFDDPNFHGQMNCVTDEVYVFPYRWKTKPNNHVVETTVMVTPTYKSRVWQTFDQNELVKITFIVEHLTDDRPEIWYPPKLITER
jgi:hypothetical protein